MSDNTTLLNTLRASQQETAMREATTTTAFFVALAELLTNPMIAGAEFYGLSEERIARYACANQLRAFLADVPAKAAMLIRLHPEPGSVALMLYRTDVRRPVKEMGGVQLIPVVAVKRVTTFWNLT